MRAVNKREEGLIYLSLLFVMAILLFNAKCFRVAVLAEKAFRGSHCGGDSVGLDDDDYSSFIGDDMELEMLMDSYIRRVLDGSNGNSKTDPTKNAKKTPSCGKGKPYGQCMDDDQNVADNCGLYHRTCQGSS
ncbi:hypothetical protein ERO13_A11G061300v2 [Gossypium hirsutum]|uniref:Rapid ALkalinization Factor n=5 Tax=Gossypium TaxID=3633 RepID=A0A5J5TIZ1_GOSBA|nr:hypothetical protein ES319_A11G068700v1 [Gossypium barbadense]KAG4173486.1 hypothetical protein ERO13_A11G061300v2 [Gossypium hirsutum]TYG92937.1 hypothetical protein ES288_A11G071700v1 [Gossypium darwinii]TYH99518.1 hypothetical protein ES332_A11G071900v1 [Gossypium tomentosum]TYJ08374.1 hypothetical protein E1A91_A11G070200v1 [Gossypium mustelinum]